MRKLGNGIKGKFKSALGICFLGGALFSVNPLGFSADAKSSSEITSAKKGKEVEQSKKNSVILLKDWHKIESMQGKCSMDFPAKAEHVAETMKIDEDGTELKYDAYISSSEAESVFMLLVAQYPDFVDEEFAQMSLEAFLNGILTHGAGSQLLFADLVLVEGHEGLDFFIRTGANYFKGRCVMVKNQLYLMAMECKVSDYDETHYEKFVGSFLLKK